MAVLSVPQIPADELRDISQLSDDKAWELDDKLICDAAQKSWTSRAYKHFDVSLERRYTEHGKRSLWFKFICKTDPANHSPQFRARKNTSSGTNNLLRRALACDARVGTNDQNSLASLPTKFSLARFQAYLALWSARNHRPFELVEDELFEAMVNELRPGTIVPDRTTISRDLQSIYQDNTELITQYFKNVDAIHLAMDGWTAPTSQSFLGIVVIWQEAGTLRRTVLEFVGLSHRHTGEYLAQKTAKCLNKYQLGKKLLTVCMDNAGNNDTFTVELQKHFPTFGGRSSRVRCIAHILNLMAKAYLNVFSQPVVRKRVQKRKSNSKSNPQPKRRQLEQAAVALPAQSRVSSNSTCKSSRSSNDINPNPPTNANTPFEPSPNDPGLYDDADAASESDGGGDSDVEETVKAFADDNIDEDKHDFDESTVKSILPEDRQKGREVLTKAARLAKRVRNSPYFQSQFEEYLSKTPLSNSRHRKLVRRVVTRWNSDLECLRSHVRLRPAVKLLTADWELSLRSCQLSDFQWDLAEQLISELKIFEWLTKIFSETKIPLIHQVVPALWKLQDRLSATVNSPAPHLHPLLRVAAHASLDVFNKYMRLFEDSSIYWIALVMCPHYKLEWFRNRAYSKSNIQRMTGLVHSKFDQMLADTEEASASQTNDSQATQWHKSLKDDLLSDDELGDDLAPRCQDTIQGYLDAPLVPVDILRHEGLLGYWARQQSVMPRVAKFALGILSAPASSIDAERAFSGGRLNINHLQHLMSELTFEAKMAVGSWFDTPLLPSVETAAAIIKSKMRD